MNTGKPFSTPLLWPLAGLALLVTVNLLIDPAFLKIGVLDGRLYGMPIDILNQGARAMVLALGMTLVIATGGVDLSVGSVMAVAGTLSAVLLASGWPAWLALPAGLGLGIVTGAINGILVSRFQIQPIVATLILMVAGRGAAQLVAEGNVVLVTSAPLTFLGNGHVFGIPFPPLLALGLFVGAHLLLRRTSAGLFVEAVGDNPVASRFAGLAAGGIQTAVYVFCGLCAALAGLMATGNIRAADPYRMGENLELDAIFAVVVGGTALTGGRFLLAGALLGALLLQTLTTTLYNLGVPPAVAPVPKAVLILIVCLFQSPVAGNWLRGLWKGAAK